MMVVLYYRAVIWTCFVGKEKKKKQKTKTHQTQTNQTSNVK